MTSEGQAAKIMTFQLEGHVFESFYGWSASWLSNSELASILFSRMMMHIVIPVMERLKDRGWKFKWVIELRKLFGFFLTLFGNYWLFGGIKFNRLGESRKLFTLHGQHLSTFKWQTDGSGSKFLRPFPSFCVSLHQMSFNRISRRSSWNLLSLPIDFTVLEYLSYFFFWGRKPNLLWL